MRTVRLAMKHVVPVGIAALVGGLLPLGVGGGALAAGALCVNPGGTGSCYASIQAAVDAAGANATIIVAAGTYTEHGITITKPLTLRGAGAASTTVDATGHTAGMIVSGVTSGQTEISGFTIENAGLEGIFVLDSSRVTVQRNSVLNNDKSLVPNAANPFLTTCPDDPEPFESLDCGEGIHLQGASFSTVASNVVQGNAGGILSSDESGPTYHNTIIRNTVQNNVLDCGIIMASHASGNGIYNNVVAFNLSDHNGAAGVGLFGSIPGSSTHDNVVIGNTLTNNGEAGVAMHIHGPGVTLDNNTIIGNNISGNGGDPDPAVNLPSIGIEVFTDAPNGAGPIQGASLLRNTIHNQAVGVYVGLAATSLLMRVNDLSGTTVGVDNAGTGTVDARVNYWGCPGGPGAAGCASVQGTVLFAPWLPKPPGPGK